MDCFSYDRCTGEVHLNTISEVAGYMMESNNDFRFQIYNLRTLSKMYNNELASTFIS